MKKSNIVISSIALAVLGVVVVCLVAFKERPEWKSERENQRNPDTEQKAVSEMMAFAAKCNQVEELVLESSTNIKGETLLSDSNRFQLLPQGQISIDTLFENGGKKLTFRIEPQKDAQVVYYYLQLLLPALKTVTTTNINLDAAFEKIPAVRLQLKGESGCELRTAKTIPALQVDLTDLSAIRYSPSSASDNINITASGNALVKMPEEIARQLQQKNKIILRDNGLVQYD